MTSVATVMGAVPIAFGLGAGSISRRPLGYAIVGGLLVSQVLTLFTTPVVYIYMDRLGHWLGTGRRSAHRLASTPAQ
jgi:multidrug efflux pump subunit AcrB